MAETEQSEKTQKPKIRHDWYQTETHIIIHILHRNTNETDLKVDFQNESLNVSFPTEYGDEYNLHLDLSYEVVPSECSFKAAPSKIEIKLKKKEGFRWVKLEGDTFSRLALNKAPYAGEPATLSETTTSGKVMTSKKPESWDKLVSDLTSTEEYAEDSDLDALFKKIYSEGSDEVKKAMNKSFTESNGTVLSTNWDEVRTAKVDCKPPDDMVLKKWDS